MVQHFLKFDKKEIMMKFRIETSTMMLMGLLLLIHGMEADSTESPPGYNGSQQVEQNDSRAETTTSKQAVRKDKHIAEVSKSGNNSNNMSSSGDGFRSSTWLTDIPMKIVSTVIGVIGVIGNGVVLIIIPSSKIFRRRTTNTFIINQSIIDTLASAILILNTLIEDINMVPVGHPTDLFCAIWSSKYFTFAILHCSTANLVILTLQRYCQMFYPRFHKLMFTGFVLAFTLLAPYIYGFAYVSYLLLDTRMEGNVCVARNFALITNSTGVIVLMMCEMVLNLVVPVLVFVICYGRMVCHLHHLGNVMVKSKSQETFKSNSLETGAFAVTMHFTTIGTMKQESSESILSELKRLSKARTNTIRTLCIVAAAYVICWSPSEIYYYMHQLGYPYTNLGSTEKLVFTVLTFCNCIVNPIIYALQYTDFQQAFKQLCCKRVFTAGQRDNIPKKQTNSTDVVTTI